MSDLWEFIVNFYHIRLIPTVKRMLARRRAVYTLLTVGVFLISAVTLSFLLCHTVGVLADHTRLATEYEEYLTRFSQSGGQRLPLAEMRSTLALAKAGETALALLWGGLWLLFSTVAVGWVMTAVVDSEAYVYGLYMIYGADRSRLSRQFAVEFVLAGIPALALGLPAGFGLYRLTGGTGDMPLRWMPLAALGFLLLIPVCSAVLSARVLKRPCMRMLNTADTSDVTVSPRRSRLRGLAKKRTALSSATLAVWRMRRHLATLALAVLLVTVPVFAILSPAETQTEEGAAFTLQFSEGMSRAALDAQYLEHLESSDLVGALDYSAADTAQSLGIHVLADHANVGGEAGYSMGERYITSSFRIACGDGDTFDELGGNLVIPEDRKHIKPPDEKEFGYLLEAVPEGYAVYVYPEGTTPPLSLQAEDTVRLYLPSDSDDLTGEYVTVRISQVIAIPSLRGEKGGPVICPRITEDYLYLSPVDYEKFCGEPHVRGFVAEEAYATEFFPDGETDGCVLVIPQGAAPFSEEPSRVTVITPKEAIKEPFRDSAGKESMPTDTYFINHTSKGVGVYLGDTSAYLKDFDAYEALHKWQKQSLGDYVGDVLPDMETREYRVTQIIYTEGGSPYITLPFGEDVHFSALQNDLCAFHLKKVGNLMMAVEEEAYLLETDTFLSASFAGRACYVGTSLLPAFASAMKAEKLQLQFSESTFLHTKTRIRNSFALNRRYYLLADTYPYERDPKYPQPRVQADYYPRVITGAGSFCHLGATDTDSILEAEAAGIRGLFSADSIGSLKAQSEVIPGQYAYNDWTVAPVQEVLPGRSLQAGHVVLITSDPEGCPIQAGDVISVALREDTQAYLSDPAFMSMQLRGDDTLTYLLERIPYGYMDMTVDEVRSGVSRRGQGTVLALTETDMGAVLGRTGIYTRVEVSPTDGADMAQYMDLYTLLAGLSKASGGRSVLKYDAGYVVRRNAASVSDPAVTRILGLLSVCMIPLLLTAAQLVFFEKREEEFRILSAVGIPSTQRKRQFALETGITALLLGLCAAPACPVGYLLPLILLDLAGVSLPAVDFDPLLCVGVSALTAVSCVAAGCVAYLRMGRDRRAPSQSLPKGDVYEGSGM